MPPSCHDLPFLRPVFTRTSLRSSILGHPGKSHYRPITGSPPFPGFRMPQAFALRVRIFGLPSPKACCSRLHPVSAGDRSGVWAATRRLGSEARFLFLTFLEALVLAWPCQHFDVRLRRGAVIAAARRRLGVALDPDRALPSVLSTSAPDPRVFPCRAFTTLPHRGSL